MDTTGVVVGVDDTLARSSRLSLLAIVVSSPGQFHKLLNPLSKVLFNFPSWYLLDIALIPTFSLGWTLPLTLSYIPKQPDSQAKEHQ